MKHRSIRFSRKTGGPTMTDDARGPQSGTDLPVDAVLSAISEYVLAGTSGEEHALPDADTLNTARLALLDALGCGMLALRFPECRKLQKARKAAVP